MTDKETQKIEFKSDWREEHLKVISAFANSKGGKMIIGIDDQGKTVGLKKTTKLLEDIPNKIRNKLGIIPSVELEKTNDHEIIKITITPSSVPISFNGKFYFRSGSTVQELKGKELTDFLIRKTSITWDSIVEGKSDLAFIDETAIENFKQYSIDRIPSIFRETNIKTILEKLQLIENNKLRRAAIPSFW